jgi:hypothetical protein
VPQPKVEFVFQQVLHVNTISVNIQ